MPSVSKPARIVSRKTVKECRKPFCERCGRKAVGEPHHIRPRSLGGSDIKENLIQLCFDCHRSAHNGKLSYVELVQIVAVREGATPREVCKKIGWPVPEEIPKLKPVVPGLSGRSLEELLQTYASLQESEDDNRWAKGAVCLCITEGMGVSSRRAASWLGCSAAQVRELSKTFKAFPDESMRIPHLTWRHHRLAANTPEPEKWISLAADNEWSTRQMDEQIKIAYGKVKEKDLQMAKAEKAYLLAKEVFEAGGEAAEWLEEKLESMLVRPVGKTVAV